MIQVLSVASKNGFPLSALNSWPKMVSVVPESCWLIVAGILGGLILYLTETTVLTPLSSGIFFFIMLPPIIFDAGYFMPNRPFFDHIGTILLFAVVGTIFNTISIGKRRSSDILIMYLCIYYSECRCKSLGLWLDWHLWFWYFTAWNTHILLTDFGGWPRGRFGSVWRSSCWSSTLHYRLWRITPQRCRHSGILKLDLKFIFFFYRVCFFCTRFFTTCFTHTMPSVRKTSKHSTLLQDSFRS